MTDEEKKEKKKYQPKSGEIKIRNISRIKTKSIINSIILKTRYIKKKISYQKKK
jgi:hypothetical protein